MKNTFKQAAFVAALSLLLPLAAFAQDAGTSTLTPSSAKPLTSVKRVKTQSISGSVTSVSGNSVMFSAKSGTAYTADASSAKIVRKFGAKMMVSDIQAGDEIMVMGKIDGSLIKATMIRDMSLQAKNATFSGKVTAVNGGSFTLDTHERGAQTVNTDSSTVFKKNGQSAQLSDVAAGSMVKVTGVWDTKNKNVTAKSVMITVRMMPVKISGTLSSKTDMMLVVAGSDAKTYNVDVTHSRIVRKNNGKSNVSELNTGDSLMINGKHVADSMDITASLVKDNSITAKSVKGGNQ